MRRIALALLVLGATPGAFAQKPAELKLGKEVRLFNGRDMAGWTHYLTDPALTMSDVWTVDPKERMIVCKGSPAGYIRTVKDYSDFILKLEWRFSPVTRRSGNSGVLLRIVGSDKVWPKSIEAQLQSGSAGDIWLIDGVSLDTPPDRVDRQTPRHRLHTMSNEKPIGEWNTYEILCHGGRVVLKVNGETLNEGAGADLLAGKIGLQSEGAEIHFRNIRLTPILK